MSTPRSLVLGGSAFIGRHLVDLLCNDGHDVTVLNRGVSPNAADVRQLVADRSDPAAVRAAIGTGDWDLVYDVSGSVHVASAESIADLVDSLDGRCGRFVFVSSIAAYRLGNGSFPWTEDMPASTSRPTGYGGHKAAVERMLADRRERTGFDYSVVRPAAVYGPHDNIPDGEIAMFQRLRQGRPVLVPHEGLVCFPYGHVADLARALLLVGIHPAAVGEIFNITADSVTALHYIRTIGEIVGVEPEVVPIPEEVLAELSAPLPFNHRFQKVMHSVMSIEKARRVLGYEPVHDFESGHRSTYEWFLAEDLDRIDGSLVDPTWGVSWDFDREAELVARLRD